MTDRKAEGPYEACVTGSDKLLYGVSGSGIGLGYYAWYGYPQNTFTTSEQAEQAARMMNIAYNAGKQERSRQIAELIR